MTSAPTIVQWNCRSLRRKKADLIEKFHLHSPSDTPAAFAIQELNGPLPALPQYDGLAPDAETSASLPRIRAALYVHRSVPFTPLDTSQWCSIITSVTGCRLLLLPRRPVLLFSVYVTPDTSLNRRTRQPLNVAFIKHFSRLYPKDDIIVCGDFNAKHTAWGYDVDLPRGTRLLADLTELKLSLLNTPDTPTRIGQTSRQQDTCPDLTWARFPQRWKWQVTSDHLGSDHLPITLHYHFPSPTSSHHNTRRDTFITKWDKFRAALVSVMDVTGFSDIIQAIQCAHKAATKRLTVPGDAPAPDAHLLTLWNRRIRLLARYRRSGRPRRLLRVLRQVQDTISRYTSELASDRWTSMCSSVSGNTNLSKVWRLLRFLLGDRKPRQPAAAVALREGVSFEELAERASDVFFPQPSRHDPGCYTRIHPVPEPIGLDSPFTLHELEAALDRANTHSAPGPDNITVGQLRNLPTALKETVLTEINLVWDSGCVPSEWRHSTVCPIPKPGKPPTSLTNLRPVSLTSCLCKTVESMLNARLQWWLESNQLLSPSQYGFRPGLSTQDVMSRLQHDTLSTSSPHLRIVAGVDVRKAFDSVPHSSVLSMAQQLGITGRAYNFIAAFLEDRTFTVHVGSSHGITHTNRVGVPQGSVLSPVLFNIVLAGLPPRLSEVPNLEHAIYADDITLWTHSGSPGYQQDAIQAGLDIIHDYIQSVGLAPAPDKTEFVVIHGGRRTPAKEAEKQCIQLTLAGTPISRRTSIRILGFHLDQDSRAATWFQRTISTSKQLNHLLYRVAHRSRGVHEHDLRIFARAFVVSRIMYGYPYYHLTRTQKLRLEIINRELQRIVTGLPRYTRIDALTSCSQMNSLDDLASTQIATQETRLRATLAGRFTLRKLGYNIDHLLPLPTPPPPWELCPLTAPRPLPRNMGEKAQARRSDFARRHLHSLLVRSSSALVFYADAAVDNNSTPIFSTAWCDVDGHRRGTQVFMTPCSSSHAELCAILHCLTSVNTFTLVPSSRIVIYTDSQEAIRALRHSSPSSAIAIQIHRAAISIRTAGHHPLIDWVPAHSGIPGNERAHRLARAKLLSARAGAPTFPTPPELTPGSFHDSHEARQEHASRWRHYLTTQANPLDFPSLSHLPLTRHETSLLQQARSGALLAPSLLAKMYPQVHINPQCTHCHIPASLPHLLWDCPLHSTARVRALSTLSPPPSTLTEWLNPPSAPDPGRVLAAFQAILRYLEDPQAPPLGSRLLKQYEPIIAAARRLSAPGNTRDT